MADRESFNMEYKNVVREFRDLVWQEDQIEPLLDGFRDDAAQRLPPPLLNPGFCATLRKTPSSSHAPGKGARVEFPGRN